MTTRKRFFLLFALATLFVTQTAFAQVCLPGTTCVPGYLTGPYDVFIDPVAGATLALSTSNAKDFAFGPAAQVVVWATSKPTATMLKGFEVTLCGPSGPLPGGLGPAAAPCTVVVPRFGAAFVTMPISAYEGEGLIQRGMTAPSGFWDVFAMNISTMRETTLPRQIHFAPAPVNNPAPAQPLVPFITNYAVIPGTGNHPQCAQAGNNLLTVNVSGNSFDSNAAIVVSYIYAVDHSHTFIINGPRGDSSVTANMLPGQTAVFLQGTIDLRQIHAQGGDSYGLGGNYYVRVLNGDGQWNPRFDAYFTVPPYTGAGSKCQ